MTHRSTAQTWRGFACLAIAWLAFSLQGQAAERQIISLHGLWQIAESRGADEMPALFPHRVPVPGLVNLARPPFPQVDQFISRENLANRIRAGTAPADWLTNYWAGKVEQDRNYFWYRRTFRAPSTPRTVAQLKINKAQFGTAVWLNGQKVGEYPGCFTASYHDLLPAIRWGAENTLIIRIGAHPAVLPDTYPTGSDFEKKKWTPGIYDEVSLIFSDLPAIEHVQVAPRLAEQAVVVQTRLRNPTRTPVTSPLQHTVTTWKGNRPVTTAPAMTVTLLGGETREFLQTIPLPNARLWSPEDPFLYVLETRTGGDHVRTRFGMREFRFDAATRRAWLNGKVYFLRGSNITLHRFFEDPLCGDLPWRETWVRRLLSELPKQMHWNYFRFCIGPVPERWFDICDEEGLLIQNEFFVWTGGPGWYQGYSRKHDPEEMIRQYRDWMRDHWNHPSVVVWDANNETKDDLFHTRVIPAVRPLDLSHRPWENSYNPPVDPNDPVEDHPYLMFSGFRGKLTFKMSDLETRDGTPRKGALPSDTNPPLINEYGWLWLNRDGTPTLLTENVYAQLLGTNVTGRQRLDLWAYLLAGKTEYWRAHRHYAGIIHFVYLTCSYPGVYTSDHFADVRRLKLDPAFADYVGEAFKPLGVYLNFFQPELTAGERREFTLYLINDEHRPVKGTLHLSLETRQGKEMAAAEQPFALEALGRGIYLVPLVIPPVLGPHTLKAAAREDGDRRARPTLSRRWVEVKPGGAAPAKP
ncbi:glycoside hydrolase family 2 TIM barrel-domain containing protein [Fontisphaera persica]|uniref:glycoside hydrolase family 2 protein n=1 Tax=Fontisphaera persica TaxID=2974023 RepID=UPI0024C02B09|nr:glycoside hydrolase family 2 TIM barrel-domain containing protein [Fontisphaera persica]WCJ58501.1 glycoside hydrolase family 2 TIM barrel-domain containing protein [Fontisphaera persica]